MNDATTERETRRGALKILGGFGLALVGCGAAAATSAGADSGSPATGDGATAAGDGATATDGATGTCATIPDETAGPYPDKTGMLQNPAFFRQDVTEGKAGLPLALTLTVVSTNAKCSPVVGAIVEIWHCDKDGVYSEYGGQPGAADQSGTTFLRGLQTTDASGQVKFTSIYPGWYGGRATHIHIEVYMGGSTRPSKTTQLAFPEEINTAVYADATGYTKGQNSLKNATDMVFSDGDEYQLATMSGDTTAGYTAVLTIGVAI